MILPPQSFVVNFEVRLPPTSLQASQMSSLVVEKAAISLHACQPGAFTIPAQVLYRHLWEQRASFPPSPSELLVAVLPSTWASPAALLPVLLRMPL